MSAPENDPRLRDAGARAENRQHIDPDAPPDVIESQIDAKRADISRTLSQLEQRFSPNQMMDYVRDNGGEVAENLGRSFKRNPVPFIVTGIGLAWLMSTTQGSDRARDDYRRYRSSYYGPGGGRDDHDYGRDPYDDFREDVDYDLDDRSRASAVGAYGASGGYGASGDYGARRPGYAYAARDDDSDGDDGPGLIDKARAKASELGESVSDGVDSLKESAGDGRDRVSEGYDRAGRSLAERRERAAAHYERMRTDAGYRAESLRRDAGRRYRAMRASGRDAGYRARLQARRGMDEASEFLQEQPLVAAAVGIAVGALIGSILPATRTEDRYLGEYSDDVRGRVAETASEQAERLKHEAASTARDVRESAEQSLSEARRTAEDKLKEARERAEEGVERADAKADEQGRKAEAAVDEKTTTGGSTAPG